MFLILTFTAECAISCPIAEREMRGGKELTCFSELPVNVGKRRQSDAAIRRRLQEIDDLAALSIRPLWNVDCGSHANGTSKAGIRTDR